MAAALSRAAVAGLSRVVCRQRQLANGSCIWGLGFCEARMVWMAGITVRGGVQLLGLATPSDRIASVAMLFGAAMYRAWMLRMAADAVVVMPQQGACLYLASRRSSAAMADTLA